MTRVNNTSKHYMVAITMLAVLGYVMPGMPVSASDQRDQQPNIIVILADDLGWNSLGYTGATFYETPNIDQLAADGMVFQRFYTAANCSPTRANLISGMYMTRHHIYAAGSGSTGNPDYMSLEVPLVAKKQTDGWRPPVNEAGGISIHSQLDPGVISIAEILNSAGYTTARIGKWHLGPDNQGFDLSTSNGSSDTHRSYTDDKDVGYRLTAAALVQGELPFAHVGFRPRRAE